MLLLLFCLGHLVVGDYCTCGPTIDQDSNLGYVRLESIVETTDCPGGKGPQDFTYLVASLDAGRNYALTYNVSICGTTRYQTLSGAWIDYNQDQEFDTSESLFSFSRQFGIQTHGFQVPVSALSGKTRMRVMVQETSQPTLDPCTLFTYGGTKDFGIEISGPYCRSGPLHLEDATQGPVALRGDTLTITETSGCPGAIGVQDLTNLVSDLTVGKSYILNSTIITCRNEFGVLGAAWIDYSRNGRFEDSERIIPYSTSYGFVSTPFKVPFTHSGVSITPGPTRLRVQVQETLSSTLDPCTLFDFGGTKDFTVNLLTGAAKSGS